jgi:septation ring formation regulator EzrA
MIDFLLSEDNISKMCKKGYSYSKVKKKLQYINEQIGKVKNSQDSLKEYLDILVSEDILFPEIARLIYKKHKEML